MSLKSFLPGLLRARAKITPHFWRSAKLSNPLSSEKQKAQAFMSSDKVVDYKTKVKEKAQREASAYSEAFARTGEAFVRKHFHMSGSEFIDFVKNRKEYPPVKVPFTPFSEPRIPELSQEIWEQMEKNPAYRELLEEDPFAFLIELGKRFNERLSERER